MHPIDEFDVLLLLATALSSKTAAQMVQYAAADLFQQAIPAEAKMIERFPGSPSTV